MDNFDWTLQDGVDHTIGIGLYDSIRLIFIICFCIVCCRLGNGLVMTVLVSQGDMGPTGWSVVEDNPVTFVSILILISSFIDAFIDFIYLYYLLFIV